MMVHKQETVDANVNGVAFLMKKHKIDQHFGRGAITARARSRSPPRTARSPKSRQGIVIATGSE
jgi:dihydrolipoamide dehydrogenase